MYIWSIGFDNLCYATFRSERSHVGWGRLFCSEVIRCTRTNHQASSDGSENCVAAVQQRPRCHPKGTIRSTADEFGGNISDRKAIRTAVRLWGGCGIAVT